ncbi:hypothetical protein GWI33_023408 [Rhynchophorus ferrugineus]|uniref:Uncharacterized protein n=1 Tax=Rhynchophorus ferrugineus TaxID=354439 RepID=A0A834IR81_RHYFE|nr:hypothetical protein GWI33_023408 [Rhynchophorus ferrugineus]
MSQSSSDYVVHNRTPRRISVACSVCVSQAIVFETEIGRSFSPFRVASPRILLRARERPEGEGPGQKLINPPAPPACRCRLPPSRPHHPAIPPPPPGGDKGVVWRKDMLRIRGPDWGSCIIRAGSLNRFGGGGRGEGEWGVKFGELFY